MVSLILFITIGYRRPIDQVPESAQVFGATVLVFEIISMFPYVDAQERGAFCLGDIHQRVVLVGRGADLQLPVFYDQPGPAAAETAHPSGIEFLLEGIKGAKAAVDIIGQFARGGSASLRGQAFPEKAMIPVTAAVIADRGADAAGFGDQFFERFPFVGSACDSLVEIVYIGLVVFTMVYLHGGRVEMWFQCVICI